MNVEADGRQEGDDLGLRPRDSAMMEGVMFDYIIVGAGSAGCVLASRLTEDPACRVLLLEAGGEDDEPAIRIPAFYGRLQDSPCDWA